MDFQLVTALFCLQFIVVIIMVIDKRKLRLKNEESDNEFKISIIVPYRNEADRLHGLIKSFNEAIPIENVDLIFVDDHSSDGSSSMISKELNFPHRIISLTNTQGKKSAIDYGVGKAVNDQILTLDADVRFGSDYLQSLSKVNPGALTVLPVKMFGNSFIMRMSSIEFSWLQLLTFSSLQRKQPSLCNGANLMFTREAYLSVKAKRKDFEISSGDDVFLLDAIKHAQESINGYSDVKISVDTDGPNSWGELLVQRKRWIQKMFKKWSISMIFGVLWLFLIQIGLIYAINRSFYNFVFLIPLAIKFLSELIIQVDYHDNKKMGQSILTTLFHQLWYPIYLMSLLFPIKDKSRWKRT